MQQRVANERQISQEVGIAGARAIFTHQGVPSPVIADFNPTPVAPNQLQPSFWRIVLGRHTREVVTRLGGGDAGLLDGALAAQDDYGSGKGEVGGGGLDGKGVERTNFDAAPAGLGVGKKGVFFKASNCWARWSRLGWLPLI